MAGIRAASLLLVVTLGRGPACAQEGLVRLAAFDHGGVEASYVLSAPTGAPGLLPLLLDFHGATPPARKGAVVTRDRLWGPFVAANPWLVAGPNGRTRAWKTVQGDKDDRAYALAVLADVRKDHGVDPERIYLSGFSSGSDFLCSGGLQLTGGFAGSLVVCPGPASVVGLKDGTLLQAKAHPFYFVAGEEDHIRKDGAWQAFLALHQAGGRVMYREVPRLAHEFPEVAEMARLLAYLETLAGRRPAEDLALGRAALQREDYLLAATHLARASGAEGKALLARVQDAGRALLAATEALDAAKEPGRAYEGFWRVRTQFHGTDLAARAEDGMEQIAKAQGRELARARQRWFDARAGREAASRPRPASRSAPATRPAVLVIPPASAPAATRPATRPASGPAAGLWSFDRYLSFAELTEHLMDLARRFPQRARLSSMGKSVEGRDLWVLEITDRTTGAPEEKPAAYVQGAIHGNEISSTLVPLFAAWQLAANPGNKRGIERLLASTTVYIAPAVNPDGVHHYLAEPHTHWRPRFNYRPHDADGDGRSDEDPYEDLDGDGEIGFMYKPDPAGEYVLVEGRMVRGTEGARYALVGREGRDRDQDGRFAEDPPGGVNLNRNFPVGFSTRRDFEGTTGPAPASEPETQAIIGFVESRANVALFVDCHNDAECVFYWTGPEATPDLMLYEAAAARALARTGYKPAPLTHAGAGLSIAWGYGARGILSLLVELESARGEKSDYNRTAWQDQVWMPPRPFRHPQLGEILIGNDWRKIARRNLHPKDIAWQVQKNWDWLAEELEGLPRLVLSDCKIERTDGGFVVTGTLVNSGRLPADTDRAVRIGQASPVRIAAEGAAIQGDLELGNLAAGERRSFRVELQRPAERVTLLASHPRAGTVRLPVLRPPGGVVPIRRDYRVEPGFATPDTAVRASNEFYRDGVAAQERGPAFKLTHQKPELKVAVLLGEWADQPHAVPAERFTGAFFSERTYTGRSNTGQAVYGSVRDFYQEMSYGRLGVTGKVFDWVRLPGTWASYRDASFGSSIVSDKLLEAVLERDGPEALQGFDGIAFVWAGNAVVRTSALWPMRLKLKDRPDVVAFKMGEFHQGEMAPIGVPCHEMGHTFGVDDKYGLGSGTSPLGPGCLMSRGTHGGDPSGRHRPFHMCAWCKMVIGWVQPAVVDPRVPQKLALRPILSGPGECYRVLLTEDGSEYLLLENRRREGFLADFPSPGLLVLHVGPNDKPASPQVRVQLIPAHGLPAARRGIVAEPERLSWPQPGRTELTVKGARLSAIRLVDDVIHLELGPAPAK